MDAAPAATPPNPKIAAIIATIRNITVQRNIVYSFKIKKNRVSYILYNHGSRPEFASCVNPLRDPELSGYPEPLSAAAPIVSLVS